MKMAANIKRIFIFFMSCSIVFITVVSAFAAKTTDITGADTGSSSGLSKSEVDAIMQDIESNATPDNITQKMDDLINRANLTGNDDLRQYAEYVKQAYELELQLNSINQSINALLAKNNNLASINNAVEKAVQINASYDEMSGIFSASASQILATLDETSFSNIQSALVEVDGIQDIIQNPSSASAAEKSLIDILMLQEAINQDLLEENMLSSAKAAINSSALVLVSSERSKYTDDEYNALLSGSKAFETKANKATSIGPSNVVMLNQSYKLKKSALSYNGSVLISIDDILKLVSGHVQYTDGTSTMAIISGDKLVEFTAGKNSAYVNDKPMSTNCPVLRFNGTTYLPAEFFAEAFDVAYVNLPDQNTIIFYANLIH